MQPWAKIKRIDMISAALLAITLMRAFTVCLTTPIAAYANNYDFVRQSSCVGVWEDYGGKDKTFNNPERPVNSLIVDGDRRPQVCMRSSDNAVPWLVGKIAGKGAHVELRAVGLVKLLILAGLLVFIFFQPITPVIRLGVMVSAYLIFGDIAILSYFDTLYLDASSVIFGFAAVAMSVMIFNMRKPPGIGYIAMFLFVVAWLTASKQQYAPFAALLGLVGAAGLLIRPGGRRFSLLCFAGVAVIQIGFFGFFVSRNDHTLAVKKANLADTFLEAVLPAAPDKPTALKMLGLPPTCEAAIGLNWYTPKVQQGQLCPEVFGLHRSQLLRLFFYYPQTLFQPLIHGAADNLPFYLPTIGHFEHPADASRWRFSIVTALSLSTWLADLPDDAYFLFVVALSTVGPFALAFGLHAAWRGGGRNVVPLLLLGHAGTLSFYAIGSAVFGDGYGDLQRHCLGVFLGITYAIAAGVIALVESNLRSNIDVALRPTAQASTG